MPFCQGKNGNRIELALLGCYMSESEDKKARNRCDSPLPQTRLLRVAHQSDLPAMLLIEQASFSLPWTEAAFHSEFVSPYSHIWVFEEQTLVIGYICTWFIQDEGQIVNVAVLPEYRRQGVGSMLVRHVLQEAKRQRIQVLSLEVRSSNRAAFDLYTRFGFQPAAVRKQYYENGEDAVLMVCNVSYIFPLLS